MRRYKDTNSKQGRTKAPIRITRSDIADLLNITVNNLRVREHRGLLLLNDKDPWLGFWNLVEYLEDQGLRPPIGTGYAGPV